MHTASIGSPAVILPITGTSTNSFDVYRFLAVSFSLLSTAPPFNNLNVLPF